jgi:hypothetical protein
MQYTTKFIVANSNCYAVLCAFGTPVSEPLWLIYATWKNEDDRCYAEQSQIKVSLPLVQLQPANLARRRI